MKLFNRRETEEIPVETTKRLRDLIRDHEVGHWKTHRKNKRINFVSYEAKLTVLWMIVCLSGNMYQVHEISSQYFKFSIDTNVQLVVEDTIDTPSLTLCFTATQLLNWKETTHEERMKILVTEKNEMPIVSGYNVKEETNESLDNLARLVMQDSDSIVNILLASNLQRLNTSWIFDHTYEIDSLLQGGFLITEHWDGYEGEPTPVQFRMKSFKASRAESKLAKKQVSKDYFKIKFTTVEKLVNVTTFIKDISKCFNINTKKEFRNFRYYNVMRQGLTPGLISYLMMNQKRLDEVKELLYVLTPADRMMRTGFYSYVPLSVESKRHFVMTWDTFEAQLLEAPFQTQCWDYQKKMGFSSRGDCFEYCLKNFTMQQTIFNKTGYIMSGSNILKDEKGVRVLPITTYPHPEVKSLKKRTEQHCNRKCHAKDCLSIVHIPKKVASKPTPRQTTIATLAPQTPSVKALCVPSLSLTNYLTDVVATFGFWLGVSCFGFFRSVRYTSEAIVKATLVNHEEFEKEEKNSPVLSNQRVHHRRRHPTFDYFETHKSYDDLLVKFVIGLEAKARHHID